jgi:alpha-acetolactate decarboxylase
VFRHPYLPDVDGRLAIDNTSNFHIELPTDGSFLAAELGGDRADEVEKVEK